MNHLTSTLITATLMTSVLVDGINAQPVPLQNRGALLVSDQGNPPFDGIFILQDLDGDGLALQPSEGAVWFDRTNAEGLLEETSNFLAIHATADGTVYAADGDSRAVYRLRDVNGDGDALDLGESSIFFDSSNSLGLPMGVPNGLYTDLEGTVYLTLAGSLANNEPDAILKLRDLNGDGDALDPGEAMIWVDLDALEGGSSVPFEVLVRDDGTALYIEFAGAPDTIRLLDDVNNDGVITADERTVHLSDGDFGVDFGFSLAADTGTIVNTNAGSSQGLWRVTDLNNSGTIDSEDEVHLLWSETENADGVMTSTVFDVEVGSNGRLFLLDSATEDRIIVLEDLNGDGDYLDAGETTVFAEGSVHNFDRPRSLTFLPKSGADASLASFSVVFGSLISGGLDDLRDSDDSFLRARSRFGFTALEPNIMQMEVRATAVHMATLMDVEVESRINHPMGTATYFLRNWTTSQYELIGTSALSNVEQAAAFTGIEAKPYVRASDQLIDLRLKHIVVSVFTALGFDSYIDQIRFTTFE